LFSSPCGIIRTLSQIVVSKYFICYLTRGISYGIIGHCKSARSLGALRTMLARHRVLLTSSISLRLRQPPRSANCASLFSTFNFKLSTSRFLKFFPCHTSENSSVSPVTATDPKMPSRKPFACHTSETPRGRFLNMPTFNLPTFKRFRNLSPFLSHYSALSCTFLHFFALTKNSTLFFSSDSALFAQKTEAGERPLLTIPPLVVSYG